MSPDAVAGPHGQMYKDAGNYYIPDRYKDEVMVSNRPALDNLISRKHMLDLNTVSLELRMDDKTESGVFFTWKAAEDG